MRLLIVDAAACRAVAAALATSSGRRHRPAHSPESPPPPPALSVDNVRADRDRGRWRAAKVGRCGGDPPGCCRCSAPQPATRSARHSTGSVRAGAHEAAPCVCTDKPTTHAQRTDNMNWRLYTRLMPGAVRSCPLLPRRGRWLCEACCAPAMAAPDPVEPGTAVGATH